MSVVFFIVFTAATFLVFLRAFMHAQSRFANLPTEAPKETWPLGTWTLYCFSVLLIILVALWNTDGQSATDFDRGLCYLAILAISFGMGRTELFRLINHKKDDGL